MSRLIKFRAWDKSEKQMYWNIFLSTFRSWLENGIEEKNLEIMQFTGLLDKSGKEIYEGDIVRIGNGELDPCGVSLIGGDGIHVVKYDEKRGKFTNTHTSNGLGEIFNHHIEIIGNIYENPELLKDQPCQH